MWLLKESKNVKILVFCCSQYIAHFVSFWYFAVFFSTNEWSWLTLVGLFIWFSHNAFVLFNTQINSWKSGNKRTIISWGVPLQNRKSNHNANEETTFARISKEAQGDFFYYHMIWIHSQAFSNGHWFDFPWPLYSIRLSYVLEIRNKDLSFNIDL